MLTGKDQSRDSGGLLVMFSFLIWVLLTQRRSVCETEHGYIFFGSCALFFISEQKSILKECLCFLCYAS